MVISYNVLNLPGGVVTTASGSLTYTYLSDGTKVSAIKSDGSGERYIGSFVYSVPASGSEVLESAAWDEGRINFTKSGSTYTKTDLWFVKDHVGNVRTVMNVTTSLSSPQVLERNDYLPFGTRMDAGTAVLTTNRFRLGGKENQTFGSLDLGKVDFGARFYDPFTAGWTTADPLATKYYNESPYSFCANNPLLFIDSDGRDRQVKKNRHTIIVSASYYLAETDMRVYKTLFSVAQAYNNMKGLTYTDENGKSYSVKFRLGVSPNMKKGPREKGSNIILLNNKDFFNRVDTEKKGILAFVKGSNLELMYLKYKEDDRNVVAHEVGHTLGALDKKSNEDIMYEHNQNSTSIMLSQDSVNEIINNALQKEKERNQQQDKNE